MGRTKAESRASRGLAHCFVALLVAQPLLAGCGAGAGVQLAKGKALVDPDQALIVPPPGGPAVTGVIEQRSSGAIIQQVHLGTSSHVPGENVFEVAYFGPVGDAGASEDSPQDKAISTAAVSTSMRKALPGVPMHSSPYFVQNAYGPFGYAVGRSGPDLCLYAWQRIRARDNASRLFGERGTIQVRLRYCKTGASEAELLNAMYGYTLVGSVADSFWNPYGPADGPAHGVGRSGHPIYPQGAIGAATVLQPRPAVVRRTRRVARAAVVAPAAAAAEKPLPRGPKIPLPDAPAAAAPASDAPAPAVPLPSPVSSDGGGAVR